MGIIREYDKKTNDIIFKIHEKNEKTAEPFAKYRLSLYNFYVFFY